MREVSEGSAGKGRHTGTFLIYTVPETLPGILRHAEQLEVPAGTETCGQIGLHVPPPPQCCDPRRLSLPAGALPMVEKGYTRTGWSLHLLALDLGQA